MEDILSTLDVNATKDRDELVTMMRRQKFFLFIIATSLSFFVLFYLWTLSTDFTHLKQPKSRWSREPVYNTRVSPSHTQVEVFPAWTTQKPKDNGFIRRIYLYSAFIDIHTSSSSKTNINLPAFQDGKVFVPINCCALFQNDTDMHTTRAELDFSRAKLKRNKKLSRDLTFTGLVFRCPFPLPPQELRGAHVTLTTTSCPVKVSEYLVVQEPVQKPEGLAICAKVAFGHHLDPYKLLEWIETQRLLGVDTIQLFECNNTAVVNKIFRHYQESGLLTLLPISLPGRPWGRSFLAGNNDWTRWNDETELPIWDCRLRLAGHQYVMDVDMDEIIMPKQYDRLKPFFKTLFQNNKVGSVHFNSRLFIEDWAPVNRSAPLFLLQYLNSTGSKAQGKAVYIPSRIHQASTHHAYPYKGYREVTAKNSQGMVFHYRKWKDLWKWKPTNTVIDHSMEKLQDDLVPAVMKVKEQLNL